MFKCWMSKYLRFFGKKPKQAPDPMDLSPPTSNSDLELNSKMIFPSFQNFSEEVEEVSPNIPVVAPIDRAAEKERKALIAQATPPQRIYAKILVEQKKMPSLEHALRYLLKSKK